MSRIGIYGGSFDPIHNGHLITAQYVLERRRLDKILFIPCNVSPHKLDKEYLSNEHRFNMVKLAIENIPHFEVSDYEINSDEVSFTYKTIEHFAKEYKVVELIIGYDNLIVFESWKNPDIIVENANLLVLKRNSNSGNRGIHKYYENAVFMQNPTIEISSTNIRERLQKKLPVNGMLPDTVREYILDNSLYQLLTKK